MAQIALSYLQLIDKWPGVVNPNLGIPTGGWANSTDNFTTTSGSTTPAYPVGTKIMAYTDNSYCPGYYTMQYLMFHGFEDQDIDVDDFSQGEAWCGHLTDNTGAEKYQDDFSGCPWYVVTNEMTAAYTDATEAQKLCLPCFTLESDGTTAATNGYGDAYGWFWVGGVCPCADATLLDDDTGAGLGFDVTTDGVWCGAVYFDLSATRPMFKTGEVTLLDVTTIISRTDPCSAPFGITCISEQ